MSPSRRPEPWARRLQECLPTLAGAAIGALQAVLIDYFEHQPQDPGWQSLGQVFAYALAVMAFSWFAVTVALALLRFRYWGLVTFLVLFEQLATIGAFRVVAPAVKGAGELAFIAAALTVAMALTGWGVPRRDNR